MENYKLTFNPPLSSGLLALVDDNIVPPTSKAMAPTPEKYKFPISMQGAYLTRVESLCKAAKVAVEHKYVNERHAKRKASINTAIDLLLNEQKNLVSSTGHALLRHGTYSNEINSFYKKLQRVTGFSGDELILAEGLGMLGDIISKKYTTECMFGNTTITQEDTINPSNVSINTNALWYSKLPEFAKCYLMGTDANSQPNATSSSISSAPTNVTPRPNDPFGRVSCTFRCIPAVANHTIHRLSVSCGGEDSKGKYEFVALRYGVPTSFEILDQSLRQHSANANLASVLNGICSDSSGFYKQFSDYWGLSANEAGISCPVLLENLLTTYEQGVGIYPVIATFAGRANEDILTREKHQALIAYRSTHYNQKYQLLEVDIAINYWRNKNYNFGADWKLLDFIKIARVFSLNILHKKFPNSPTYLANLLLKNPAEAIGTLKNLDQQVDNYISGLQQVAGEDKKILEKIQWLKNSICALELAIASPPIAGRNKALYIAAMVDVITRLMGGVATGNCKSAKDRKGFELLMADAILVHMVENRGEVPQYNYDGAKRGNLVRIFCRLFCSGHQQIMAATNGVGSYGIGDYGSRLIDEDFKEVLGEAYYSKELAELIKPGANYQKKRRVILWVLSILSALIAIVTCSVMLGITPSFFIPMFIFLGYSAMPWWGFLALPLLSGVAGLAAVGVGYLIYLFFDTLIPSSKTFTAQNVKNNPWQQHYNLIVKWEVGAITVLSIISFILVFTGVFSPFASLSLVLIGMVGNSLAATIAASCFSLVVALVAALITFIANKISAMSFASVYGSNQVEPIKKQLPPVQEITASSSSSSTCNVQNKNNTYPTPHNEDFTPDIAVTTQ
jgi:hypothetical protein